MKYHLTLEGTDEEIRAAMEALTGHADTTLTPAPEPEKTDERTDTALTPAPEPEKTDDDVETDIDGMPWSADVHASTKSKNADGRWKAKQGAAEEAKKARADFLAAGGNVESPDTSDAPAPAAPAAAPGAPSLPDDAPAPETRSREDLYALIGDLVGASRINGDQLNAMYEQSTGTVELGQVHEVLGTNETARAKLGNLLDAVE